VPSEDSGQYSSPSPISTPRNAPDANTVKRKQKYILSEDLSDSSTSTSERLRKSSKKTSSCSIFHSKSKSNMKNEANLGLSSYNTYEKIKPREKRSGSYDVNKSSLLKKKRSGADTESVFKNIRENMPLPPPPKIIYKENDHIEECHPYARKNFPETKILKDKDEKPVSNWNVKHCENSLSNFTGVSESTSSGTTSGSFLFESFSYTSSSTPCQSPGESTLNVLTVHNPIFEDDNNLKNGNIMKTAQFMAEGNTELCKKQVHEATVEVHVSGAESDRHTLQTTSQPENKERKLRPKDYIYNDNSFTIHEEEQKDENTISEEVERESTRPTLTSSSSPVPILAHFPSLSLFTRPPPPPPPPPSVPAPPLPLNSGTSFFKCPEIEYNERMISGDISSSTITVEDIIPQDVSVRSTSEAPAEVHLELPIYEKCISKTVGLCDFDETNSRSLDQRVKLYMKGEGTVSNGSQDGKHKNFEILILDHQQKSESPLQNWILKQSSFDVMSSPTSSTSSLNKKTKKDKVFSSGTLTKMKTSLENLLQNPNSKAKVSATANVSSLKMQKNKTNSLNKEKKDCKTTNDDINRTYRIRKRDISRPIPIVKITQPPTPKKEEPSNFKKHSNMTANNTAYPLEIRVSCEGTGGNLSDQNKENKASSRRNPKQSKAISNSNRKKPEKVGNISKERFGKREVGRNEGRIVEAHNRGVRRDSAGSLECPRESHYIIEAPVQLPKLPARRITRREALRFLDETIEKLDTGDKHPVNSTGKTNGSANATKITPPKSILKKASNVDSKAPVVPRRRPQGSVVTYRLPSPPPPRSEDLKKDLLKKEKRSKVAESDTGYDCDTEFSNGEVDHVGDPASHTPPLPPRKANKRTMVSI
ncbi:hypothetical protein SK128_001670, partial [Halocaridina rubra]